MKRTLSAALIIFFIVLCNPLKTEATVFDDVSPFNWYYDAVMYLRTKDIVYGVEVDLFKPNGLMKRSDFTLHYPAVLQILKNRQSALYFLMCLVTLIIMTRFSGLFITISYMGLTITILNRKISSPGSKP